MMLWRHTKDFQKNCLKKWKPNKEDDQSVPYLYNGYYYITRFEKEKIILFIQKKEVFLPMKKFYLTVMSWPKDTYYFQLGGLSVSPDNKFASFGIDIVGRRIYTIQIKILKREKSFRIRLKMLLETRLGKR
jgi:oligopeptidase B